MLDFLDPFREFPNLSRIARRYQWTVPIVVVLGLANGLLESIGIGLLIPLLSTLSEADLPSDGGFVGWLGHFASGMDPDRRLQVIAATMLGFILVKAILQTFSRFFAAMIDSKVGHDVRSVLASRLLTVGYPFYFTQDAARLINIVGTESWSASAAIQASFNYLASLGTILVFGLGLLVIDWRLAIIVGGGAGLLGLLQSRLVGRLKRESQSVSQTNRALTERMLAVVYQSRLIRLFNGQADEQARFEQASAQVRRAMLSIDRMSAVLASGLGAAHAGLLVVTLLVAASAGISLPVIAAFVVLVNRLQPHLRMVESAATALAAARNQVCEVEWLLSSEGKPRAPRGSRAFAGLKHAIEFRSVSYTYPTHAGAPRALTQASFTIPAGCSTALIGKSGAGKSTIINLACRLVDPTEGMILVDRVPLSDIRPEDWLAVIGIAGQDVDLIEGTFADNIRYGRATLSASEVEEAARAADAHDFIMGSPARYATDIGLRGLSLSGGQRQRIGIARALARKPSLLILDEATNAVDGSSESAILEVLKRVNHRITIIVISHRPSTLSLCDHGVALEDGTVKETGRLSALKAYRRMLEPACTAE